MQVLVPLTLQPVANSGVGQTTPINWSPASKIRDFLMCLVEVYWTKPAQYSVLTCRSVFALFDISTNGTMPGLQSYVVNR